MTSSRRAFGFARAIAPLFCPSVASAAQPGVAPCGLTDATIVLIGASFFGATVAFASISILSRQRARHLDRRLRRQAAQIEALVAIESNYKALVCLESVCCVIWGEGTPRIVVNTLPPQTGVPGKLPQLLRFASWLHPDDASRIAESVSALETGGVPFVWNASTLEGHVLEIAGGVSGPDAIIRLRPFSPLNKDLLRLIGENKRLTQTLKDREKLLDTLPIPVWFRDVKGSLTWVNSGYAQAVKAKTKDEALQKQIELFEAQQRANLVRAGHTHKSTRMTLQTVVDGAVRTYEAISAPVERGSGGAAFDVAPLASAQDELERQMSAHSRTLDRVSTGVAIFGANRKFVYGNGAFAHIWNVEKSWLKQRPTAQEFFDLMRQKRLLPEQPNYRKWRDDRVLAWDAKRTLDEIWHRPDGKTVHVVTDCRDDGGVTFLFDDVTEKLALEREFHNLIESQRETLDHLSEGIAVFGADGRLRLFNPAFQSLWRLDEAVLRERPHLDQLITECETHAPEPAFWQILREAITGIPEGRDLVEGTIAKQDQAILTYALTPLPDGGTLLTFSDVTDRKRFEEVLLERNEALEASDRLKTVFLSHVSYELRTPLTTIIGFADLLAEPITGSLNPKQRDYLNDIKTSSQVLLTIINDIIDLAVIDAGAMDLKLAPVEIRTIVEAAELGVKERLARANVHLDIHIVKGAEIVTADANRLTQVLYNLLSNAIGFSPEDGTITLTCRRERNGVTISVQDTGLGIPEEEQATVFERFETRSKGSRHRGAGLGLSLVKSIVELHKGRVDLRSTPGAGTTVTIFLPDDHPALNQSSETARAALPAS